MLLALLLWLGQWLVSVKPVAVLTWYLSWWAERTTMRTTILSSPVTCSRSVCAGQVPGRRAGEPATFPPSRLPRLSGVPTLPSAAAGVTVAVLAGIAAAISYSHMRELAAAHGQTGWRAHTFPLSVDGIEIVASLVLLADRRTGRASGWLPWAALAAGTAASLAANVAAAGADLVGRVIAGWPAFALLVAIKLLSQMLEPRPETDRPTLVDDRAVPASDRPHAVGTTGDGPGTAAGPLPVPPVTAANGHRVSPRPSCPARPCSRAPPWEPGA